MHEATQGDATERSAVEELEALGRRVERGRDLVLHGPLVRLQEEPQREGRVRVGPLQAEVAQLDSFNGCTVL